jgi:hypothetical protein
MAQTAKLPGSKVEFDNGVIVAVGSCRTALIAQSFIAPNPQSFNSSDLFTE